MKKFIQLNPITISIITISIGIFAYLYGIPFLDLMELKTIDLRFKTRGRIDPSPNIVMAVVDEKSLAKEGKWVWPRSKFANLINRLSDSGARVIAFDIGFLEPDNRNVVMTIEEIENQIKMYDIQNEPLQVYLKELKVKTDNDQLLASAIQNSKASVVLGYFFQMDDQSVQYIDEKDLAVHQENILHSRYMATRLPPNEPDMEKRVLFKEAAAPQSNVAIISNAAEYSGTFNHSPDPDGVIRRVPAVFRFKDSLYAPLSVMTVSAFLEEPPILSLAYDAVSSYQIGELYIPTDEIGQIMINYRGKEKTFPHVSVTDILSGHVPKMTFQDKIVLVGVTATAIFDMRSTPFEEIYPGIEIHATIIDSILTEDFLYQPDGVKLLNVSVIVLGTLLLGIILSRTGVTIGLASFIGLFLGYIWLCQYMFTHSGWILNMVYPLSVILLVYVSITTFNYLAESKQKRFVRDAFSTYLSPAVVKQLMDSPEKLKLGGEERVITAYFSDIQGFTGISEKLTPSELVELLNEFLTEMTNIILKYEGLVDKFEGDAIIALFGAPNDIENHAEVAVKASIDMQKRLVELREHWKVAGKPELKMRIGLYSGPAVVGNMGSESRMDYTMMGNTVNVASRLEGVNKIYGTYTMIGETTYEAVGSSVFARELDLVNVVGKHEPVRIYELIGYPEDVNEHLRVTIDHYHKGLSAYRSLLWDDAIESFSAALALTPDDKPSQTLLARCVEFKSDPPDVNWNGTYTMKTK